MTPAPSRCVGKARLYREKAENAGRLQLNQLWTGFLNRIAPGDTVAFYFSRHGVEVGGSNYLIPRDLPKVGTNEEELLKFESLSFGKVLDGLRQRQPGVRLLILDAGRGQAFRRSRVTCAPVSVTSRWRRGTNC